MLARRHAIDMLPSIHGVGSALTVCWRRSTKLRLAFDLTKFKSGRKSCNNGKPAVASALRRNNVCPALASRPIGARHLNPHLSRTTAPSLDTMKTFDISQRGKAKQLAAIFCLWKALLLVLAAFCPGPGYDTSALVLLDPSLQRHSNFKAIPRHERFVLNLLRWDAFYFVKAAERGHVHEQAWAFSWVYSHILRLTGQCERWPYVV